VPAAAREDALKQVLDLGTPVLLAANRQFHRLLVGGVPVQYQRTAKPAVTSCAWSTGPIPARNEWLAVNQFSITGPHHTRRPDIILFVNGLPLVLIELKNPADQNADVWKAFHQIQTYKEQIPTPSSTTRCWSSPTAARRCWARSRPQPSASWPGAPSTA
jgi:type I restriction enzyme R subunit